VTSPDRLRSPRFLGAARWWARRELRRTLDGLRVAGLDSARALAAERPVIFAATHVSFWDPFVLVVLDEALGTESYAVMDEVNLCRIPFFVRIGAIPMRRDQPRAGLRAAASMLDRPGRVVWVFPQGEHRPPHLRPLRFLPGVRLLARLAPPSVAVVPVGLQYAFGQSEGPVAYASFGEPLTGAEVAADAGVERLEEAVEEELSRIDRLLAGEPEPFRPLVPSRSWDERLDVGTRMLNWWLRPRPRPRHERAR
jgi:1-acyl-sn-glycerol-3-phosphate acyltransferase